jgi:hypothetical protein
MNSMPNLTVKEYLTRYKAGENSDIMAEQISQQLGRSMAGSTLTRRMKNLGYRWNNSKKNWEWTKVGEPQPLEHNLLQQIRKVGASKGGRPKKKRPDPKKNEWILKEDEQGIHHEFIHDELSDEQRMNSAREIAAYMDFQYDEQKVHHSFTVEETRMIKEVISAWQSGLLIEKGGLKVKEENIHQRIVREELGSKTRKTIVIANKAGEALDCFCDENKLNKWEVMSLAVLDFIERYKK